MRALQRDQLRFLQFRIAAQLASLLNWRLASVRLCRLRTYNVLYCETRRQFRLPHVALALTILLHVRPLHTYTLARAV